MGSTGVIDRFLDVFTRYIDSGFGLLQGDVKWLAATLIAIDLVLAGLFWAMSPDEDVIARLIKKTLFIGLFAFLINNWNTLARIVFESFARLGLKASGTGLFEADFLRPGRIAQVGLDAGRPILESISGLMGYVSFFENFLQIVVLLFAWAIVLLAFFILAIQLFVSLIEFKLTTLCGFVLIPFGLLNKTAFAAERVLGNVVSSGIKVLVLAVVVGIGSTLFSEFTQGFGGQQPTIEDAMALVLAALALLGLGIFGPGIANGIVSGGPQLGAGAAVGTGLAAGGTVLAGAGVARLGAGVLAGTARAGASVAGGASTAYKIGATDRSGAASVVGGMARVGRAGAQAATGPLRRTASDLQERFEAGGASIARGGAAAAEPAPPPEQAGASPADEPAWARRMRRHHAAREGVSTAIHALRSGEHAGSGSSVSLSEE